MAALGLYAVRALNLLGLSQLYDLWNRFDNDNSKQAGVGLVAIVILIVAFIGMYIIYKVKTRSTGW